jgi:hypothetical protein
MMPLRLLRTGIAWALELVEFYIFAGILDNSCRVQILWHESCRKATKKGLLMATKNDITKDILNYLFNHADASDTLEGITEWWLLSQRISYEMKRVKAAILKLVEEGWISEIKGRNSTVRYCLNPDRRHRMNQFGKMN